MLNPVISFQERNISGAMMVLRCRAHVENWKFLLAFSGLLGGRRRFQRHLPCGSCVRGGAYNFLDYRWCGCGHTLLNFLPRLIFLKYLGDDGNWHVGLLSQCSLTRGQGTSKDTVSQHHHAERRPRGGAHLAFSLLVSGSTY